MIPVIPDAGDDRPPPISPLRLFLRFLTFGALAFGGPVAQIAMIRRELVDRERWISSARFNRLLAVLQALPGPEAHELCVHLGVRAGGRLGGLLAGLGFMLPGLLLMLGAAWIYTTFAPSEGALSGAFLGIQVVVVAIIVVAVRRIGVHILEDRPLWALAVIAALASLAGAGFWIVLVAAGALYPLIKAGRKTQTVIVALLAVLATSASILLGSSAAPGPILSVGSAPVDTLALFWAGLKAGLLTFGGAYTAIPFMRSDTVGRGWIDDAAFLDGVAIAGVLPAPLIIFCSFVGYVVGGLSGALAVTLGVFLPAFAFSLIFYERLEQVVENLALHRALAGIAAATVGLITATTLQLGWATTQRLPSIWPALVIFAVGLAVLLIWKSRFTAPILIVLAGVFGVLAFP